jgi:hypothetical protein
MTEEPSGPSSMEQDAIYESVGMALLEVAPVDWTQIDFTLSALAGIMSPGCTVRREGGAIEDIDPPDEAWQLLTELRDEMYQPGKGAWFTAKYTITRPGRFNVDFDYESEPDFDVPPSALSYLYDFEHFPRDTANTPDWLREKLEEARNSPAE